MNIAIIYHSADWDGKLSNEVCRFHLAKQYPGATISSIGWDYGQPVPVPPNRCDPLFGGPPTSDWSTYDQIYMVDLCIDALMEEAPIREKLIWIDHHASAIEKWSTPMPLDGEHHPDNPVGTRSQFRGFRIDGVAACRLCWQWFTYDSNEPLTKALFVDRKVTEPELIRLAGEHDVWDHRDERALPLQFGLSALNTDGFDVGGLDWLIREQFDGGPFKDTMLEDAVEKGRLIKAYIDKRNAEHALANAVTVKLAGLTFCCLNVGQPGNSQLFTAALKEEYQACLAWRHTGKAVLVSLYGITGKSTDGILEIALSFGGGGHKGACGFRITMEEMAKILDGKLAERMAK